jgi:hypothetical protein
LRSIWSQSFHGKRICDSFIHLVRFNQGNTCNICWPSHQALCLVMASFMLYLHKMGANPQNGPWYVIIVKGRLTLMAECKASPTSPHHLKFHSSSKKILKLLFPSTKSYSPPSNPSFCHFCTFKHQYLFLLNILLLSCCFFLFIFRSSVTT